MHNVYTPCSQWKWKRWYKELLGVAQLEGQVEAVCVRWETEVSALPWLTNGALGSTSQEASDLLAKPRPSVLTNVLICIRSSLPVVFACAQLCIL